MNTSFYNAVENSSADPPQLLNNLDKFLTYREAAVELNVPYHVIQKSAKIGTIPTYTLFGKRRYVRLADILRVMNAA